MKKGILLAILILIPTIGFAQRITDLKDQSTISKNSWSLLDPSRFKMHQSYSFGFYSGGGHSTSIGYYLNSIEYTFSNPLTVRLDLGFVHNPGAMLGSSSSKAGAFVPGFSLNWRPSASFNFRLDFRQVPVVNGFGYNNYYNPGFWEDYR
jgi:hypothetical protein